ncbi:histidine kinase dimerization/phospho-acceptor domain-containing protein, partial [Klebsiella pneumoniae]|uniref:histidine kinase dimerization/phospho-acceptor domain-containing protein n=1 Tax=Klebsiella pneumoniae TaxID=573 RepID=UPI0025A0C5B3
MIISDISEARKLRQYLVRAEKLAGIGLLASGIAHELNNPLFVVLGLAEALLEEKDHEKVKEYADDIVKYTTDASAIIRELTG